MRAFPILLAMMFAASAPLPALARPTAAPDTAPHLLVPTKHHWHYGRWRYRYHGWAGYPPYYAAPPETQAQGSEAPALAYPPAVGSGTSAPAAPAQTTPDPGASRTPSARPRIEWVNPDRPAR